MNTFPINGPVPKAPSDGAGHDPLLDSGIRIAAGGHATDEALTILIVDDELDNRQILALMLGDEGFVLSVAACGEAALAAVASARPDLILLDVMMPDMNGFEVTRSLKASAATRDIPILLVTAMDDQASRRRGLRAGADDFLAKPVGRRELRARVRRLLGLPS